MKGRWCYLYRAIDSAGATIDFLLSALRDADAAKRLFRKALSDPSHPQPRVINTDLAPIYGSAIPDIKKEGTLRRRCRHRPVQYLNNILEQDHRAIKRRVNAKQGFREFQAARRTIQGYEAMNMIRKGQVRWVSGTMSGVRFTSSTSSSNWPPEIAVRTCPSSQFCQAFKVATHPFRRRQGTLLRVGEEDVAAHHLPHLHRERPQAGNRRWLECYPRGATEGATFRGAEPNSVANFCRPPLRTYR